MNTNHAKINNGEVWEQGYMLLGKVYLVVTQTAIKFCTALYEECNAFHSIPLYFIHNILLLGVNAVVVQSKLPIKLVKVYVLSL